jgi:hypothetical protein
MSMWINLNHYCLNMELCRRPPSLSIHSCSRDGNTVVTRCSTSLGTPWLHSGIRCFKSLVLAGLFFRIPRFWRSPKINMLLPQDQASGWTRRRHKTRNDSAWKNVLMIYIEVRAVWAVSPSCWDHRKWSWQGRMFPVWRFTALHRVTAQHSAFSKTQRRNNAMNSNCKTHCHFSNMQKTLMKVVRVLMCITVHWAIR